MLFNFHRIWISFFISNSGLPVAFEMHTVMPCSLTVCLFVCKEISEKKSQHATYTDSVLQLEFCY